MTCPFHPEKSQTSCCPRPWRRVCLASSLKKKHNRTRQRNRHSALSTKRPLERPCEFVPPWHLPSASLASPKRKRSRTVAGVHYRIHTQLVVSLISYLTSPVTNLQLSKQDHSVFGPGTMLVNKYLFTNNLREKWELHLQQWVGWSVVQFLLSIFEIVLQGIWTVSELGAKRY
jgi:hypothetical protein